MSNTRTPAAKKAATKKAASPSPIKSAEEPEPVSPAVQMALDLEQSKLNEATMQAQLAYLTGRVAELVKENHELRGGDE